MGRREIYRGWTPDGGATWRWTALTRDSEADNIRPVCVRAGRRATIAPWMRGRYRAYTDFQTDIAGLTVAHGRH
ncbi:MAG: hypothetical protein M1457_06745 [bacterium]|nr:hypothetical protein [bacterium]